MRSLEQKLLAKHRIRTRALRILEDEHGLSLKPRQVTPSVTLEKDGNNILPPQAWFWISYKAEQKEGSEVVPFVVGQELRLGKKQRRVIEYILRAKGQL